MKRLGVRTSCALRLIRGAVGNARKIIRHQQLHGVAPAGVGRTQVVALCRIAVQLEQERAGLVILVWWQHDLALADRRRRHHLPRPVVRLIGYGSLVPVP
jgi:hypothetical protein